MNGGSVGMDFLYQVRRFADLDPVHIDGFIFKLHYWFTSTAIFSASLISFAKQYFGDPIECIFDAKHGAEIKAVDAYCWLHSTTNLDTGLMRKLNTLPKIRNPCQGYPMADHDIDTLYYQWVPFFLFFQALIFRLPWNLWRHLEGGKMAEFGLEAKRHLIPEQTSESLAHQYAHFFNGILHHNNIYFWQYVFCESLNVFIVFGMIQLTDKFLNGRFIDYGRRVWEFYWSSESYRADRMNPMCSLFPTVTSCQFPSGALTGNLNVDHAMCVLSLNIINDKIFLIEWFWFITLAFMSLLASFCTFLIIICPRFRRFLIRMKLRSFGAQDVPLINQLLTRCYVGDWFILNLLAKNTTAYMFRRIIKSLTEIIKEQRISKTATISMENLEVKNGV
ncbi:hypothetical protein TCAL_08031 [Tigriopus californicus]|uniref:Innexin n=1 Tax=Tigriopus californicus TaxID=6832 RepID=A0A553NNA8_TIGCA|nr:innexin inx2-like [Tigriopus californicus]TRY66929.1 hypothetical protein TCAL_08031 [Tigriopus californicus]|eukprot:TCALIF_08031-PA protein Name:"Similar to inx2 Innexin inx2 (Schistocerca americana)" AED:0.11 eAED:0.11 QI:0/1/0.4/1/1/1/5/72/390